jgi:hypothetical protein
MMSDIFDYFAWHSAIGIDETLAGDKKFVTRMPNTREARSMFAQAGDLLVHKVTKSLWKFSDDGASIEPVFSSDVLTEDEVREAMEESDESQ